MRCFRDILGFTLWDRRQNNHDLLEEADEQLIEKHAKPYTLYTP
jgi:hypothetical protein